MAEYQKFEGGPAGKWADKSKLVDVKRAYITNEVKPSASKFLNDDGTQKMQNVGLIKFEGFDEPMNMAINGANINALVDAFGKDSKGWINQKLTVNVLEGDKGFSVYLIPEGFKRARVDNRVVIVKDTPEGEQPAPADDIPVINIDDDKELKIEDVPF